MNIFHDMISLLINSIYTISKGAFLWDYPDQDQWTVITRAMVDQMNRWILVQSGFIGSFNLPWSEWSQNTDPDPNHLKGTHPKWFLGRGLVKSCGRQEYHGNGVALRCRLRPRAWGSGFYLSFENFEVISKVDKSQDHGKVLSIFV